MTVIPYSVNRRELWDDFVDNSKNGTFLLKRGFMDLQADRYFDCSVMVFEGVDMNDENREAELTAQNLVALMPANWDEKEQTVHSHQGLTYGGLILRQTATQLEVMEIIRDIALFYISYLQARRLVYKPIPYIYSSLPSAEDLYALFRAHARLTQRRLSTAVPIRNPLRMRTTQMQQARKAIDYGFYIDRMPEGDWQSLDEYWQLLTDELARNGHSLSHTLDEIKLLIERFPRQIRLYLVRHSQHIVAGVIVFETRQVAHIQYVAATDEGRQYGALDLIFRHLINERYRQMEYVDFGISNDDSALILQKENYGGRTLCYDTYEVHLHQNNILRIVPQPQSTPVSQVKFLDLQKVTDSYQPQIDDALLRVTQRGWYLLGEEASNFEQTFATYVGARHCIGVGNGLEALTLILMAYRQTEHWQPGDEVIVPANTFIATILAVTHAGLTPVLCEPDPQTFLIDTAQIEPLITPRTRAVIPVHLYGRSCDITAIRQIADIHQLKVIDDAAQAHGAMHHGRRVGSLCDATAFSFYPTKNLGALGDAGGITTDDDTLAQTVRALANYGSTQKYQHQFKGINSRMDELQAAVLAAKLPQLDSRNQRRRQIAERYRALIQNPLITHPQQPADPAEHVYYAYVIRCPQRDQLRDHLARHGIQTLIHYPTPPHRQEAYAEWSHLRLPVTERLQSQILSLPISSVLTDEEVNYVAQTLNAFNE